jgi:hypothetical protein
MKTVQNFVILAVRELLFHLLYRLSGSLMPGLGIPRASMANQNAIGSHILDVLNPNAKSNLRFENQFFYL